MQSDFVLNPLMTVAGIVLIPVIVWFLSQRQTKKTLFFGLLFLLIFSRGTLELLGIPSIFIRFSIEILIIFVFVSTILARKSKINKIYPGIFWFILFVIISILSAILNSINFASFLLFYREYFIIFLFFYAMYNRVIHPYEINLIGKLLILLCIVQIPANVIKVIIIRDIIEPYIGTMANLGGSLSIMFALIGASYAISIYLVLKRRIYLIFILGFILFSVFGGKRAAIVYFPFLFIILSLIYQRRFETFKLRGLKKLILFSIVSICLLYMSVRLMPSLNKERQVWGSFDLSYALDYSQSYVSTGAGAIKEIGRAEAPAYLFYLTLNDNPYNLLLGYGPGHLVKSSFNKEMTKAGSQSGLTQSLYGVGYSARTSFLQLFLQTGLLGVLFYLMFIFSIYRKTRKDFNLLKDSKTVRYNYLFFIGLWFAFILDFFTYSVEMTHLSTVSLVFIYFLTVQRREFLILNLKDKLN